MLRRQARQGRQGFPVATIAFYGPDNKRASKVVLGVIAYEGAEPQLTKWMSATADVRHDVTIAQAILERLRAHGVRSVAMVERIIGCPHETGVDYPDKGRVVPNVRIGGEETGGVGSMSWDRAANRVWVPACRASPAHRILWPVHTQHCPAKNEENGGKQAILRPFASVFSVPSVAPCHLLASYRLGPISSRKFPSGSLTATSHVPPPSSTGVSPKSGTRACLSRSKARLMSRT